MRRLFDSVTPCGITPTGEKLEELLLDYLLKLESAGETKPKPVNFVILTDGAPSEPGNMYMCVHGTHKAFNS